ncbi:MAG TPA: DUF5677 domain-containing protein [Candidatus Kryptonia bacterium]
MVASRSNAGNQALSKNGGDIESYIRFSEKAHRIYLANFRKNRKVLGSGHNWVFHLLLANSMNLSSAISTLAALGKPNEAMILLRTRLEQLIICSYLIHEDEEAGLKRFVAFLPKVDPGFGRTLKKIDMIREGIELLFPEMGTRLPKLLEKMDATAEKSFGFGSNGFIRKWSEMNTGEIVARRDKLADKNDLISSYRLSYYYDTIYKFGSVLVHADVASISPAFVVLGNEGTVRPHEIYTMSATLINAHLDIIQCHEVSKKLDLLNEKKFFGLYEKYIGQIKSDFGIRDKELLTI